MSEERVRGYVRQFDELQGTGFIDADDEPMDVFVHIEDVQTDAEAPTLKRGQRVEFWVEENEKGFQARDVRTVEAEV